MRYVDNNGNDFTWAILNGKWQTHKLNTNTNG